jgi:hypothetical protein
MLCRSFRGRLHHGGQEDAEVFAAAIPRSNAEDAENAAALDFTINAETAEKSLMSQSRRVTGKTPI